MTEDDLRAELAAILDLEARHPVDWAQVERRCLSLVAKDATRSGCTIPVTIYRFIDDPDIRQKDEKYAANQRRLVIDWLGSGCSA